MADLHATQHPGPRSAFDELAQAYDSTFSGSVLGRLLRERVWWRLDSAFGAGQRVLDVGCGTGEDAMHLASRGVHVVATDASSAPAPPPTSPTPPTPPAGIPAPPARLGTTPAESPAQRAVRPQPPRRRWSPGIAAIGLLLLVMAVLVIVMLASLIDTISSIFS